MHRERDGAQRAGWMAAAFALAALACAGSPPPEPHAGVASRWGRYLSLPHQRAFALAGDPDGIWVGAGAGGYRSRLEAEREALRRCEHRRERTAIPTSCRLYATGHRIVWPDAPSTDAAGADPAP